MKQAMQRHVRHVEKFAALKIRNNVCNVKAAKRSSVTFMDSPVYDMEATLINANWVPCSYY
jgi:hypothetical protein